MFLPLAGKPLPAPVPAQLRKGDYMVCYDIREKHRLQRIQRLTAKRTVYLQRSVYLYRGTGNGLLKLLEKVRQEMQGDDDLRIYNMSHIRDMWFLSDDKPVVTDIKVRELVRSGYDWLGMARLSNCVDYIPHDPLLKNLCKLCGDKMLVGMVRDTLNSYPVEFRPFEKKGRGLPPNLILTPWLCELYLRQFDNFLFHKDIVLVRVREEFAVFAQDEATAQRAFTIAAKQLKRLGLVLSPEQSQVIYASAQYKFLGKRLPNIEPWFQLKNWVKQLRGYGMSLKSNIANRLSTVRDPWVPSTGRLKNEPPVFDDWEVEK